MIHIISHATFPVEKSRRKIAEELHPNYYSYQPALQDYLSVSLCSGVPGDSAFAALGITCLFL